MNIREQLAEMEWTQLNQIMHEFFVSECRSWQAEILDEITDEDDHIFVMVRDMVIDKIASEVTSEELQEAGYDIIPDDIENAA